MLQVFGLTKGINEKELSAKLGFVDGCVDYSTRITSGDFVRRMKPCDGELVVTVLTLFVVLRLAQCFLEYGFSELLCGSLTTGWRPDHFWMVGSDFFWNAMLARSSCGFVSQ